MAKAFQAEAVIRRPIADVWDRLTDWEHADEWMNGISSLRADGDTAVGTTLTVFARGKERTSRIEIATEHEFVRLVSQQGSVTATYDYSLDEVTDTVTDLLLEVYCEASGPMRVLTPLLRFVMRRADHGQPAALKALLEA